MCARLQQVFGSRPRQKYDGGNVDTNYGRHAASPGDRSHRRRQKQRGADELHGDESSGKPELAEDQYRAALTIDPNQPQARAAVKRLSR